MKLTDDIIRANISDARDSWLSSMTSEEEHDFSPAFEGKMTRLLRREKLKLLSLCVMRDLAASCAMIFILCAVIFPAAADPSPSVDIDIRMYSDRYEVRMTIEQENYESPSRHVGLRYLTDGLEYTYAEQDQYSYRALLELDTGSDYTGKSVYIEGTGLGRDYRQTSHSVLNPYDPVVENVTVSGQPAKLITMGGQSELLWSVGNWAFRLFGTRMDRDELIKIAEGVYLY